MTTKKGRPTPKAPQNRPKPKGATPTRVTLDELSPEQQAAVRAHLARKLARRQLAPMRRAFKGIVSIPETVHLNPALSRRLSQLRIETGRYARQDQAEMMAEREAAKAAREAAYEARVAA